MVLTLATRPTPEPRERLVVPACLQSRAPLGYEILDEHDRRIAPTLAGYKLRRGRTYRLVVRTQEKQPAHWELRLLAPRSVLEPAGPDEIDGDARAVYFHTRAAGPGEIGKRFGSHLTAIPVHLDFQDGREPYRFSIPIVLLASRFRWVGSLLLTAALSVAAEAVFRERLAVPSLAHVALFGGLWVLVVLLCVFWDQWKFYRRALHFLAETGGPAVRPRN